MAFDRDLNPALHSAEAKVTELPSGTSLVQFLMVFLTSEILFIDASALWLVSKKSRKPSHLQNMYVVPVSRTTKTTHDAIQKGQCGGSTSLHNHQADS